MKALIFMMAALVTIGAAAEQTTQQQAEQEKIYTWVDKEGVTHYSRSAEAAVKNAEVEPANLDEQNSLSIIPGEITPEQPGQNADSAADTAPTN